MRELTNDCLGVELLNEPRISDEDFSMTQLKDFYGDGTSVISSIGTNDQNVTIHGVYQNQTHSCCINALT